MKRNEMGFIIGCILVIIISSFGIKAVRGEKYAALKGALLFLLMGLLFERNRK
jgi:L-cystine uptake protein TcyP (sodium:dicarboxylate symporter family)